MVSLLARTGKLIARSMLGLLLFAQLTLSAQACMMPTMAREAVLSSGQAMVEGCGSLSSNACLAQWTAGDQMVDSLPPPAVDLTLSAASPPVCMPVTAGDKVFPIGPDRQTDPPSRIRYCRYLK